MLGLQTVAEGVEDEEQLKLLKELNCDVIQGFYYSPPLEVDEFTQWLYKHQMTHN